VIGTVVFDVGECLVAETREYGTLADWLASRGMCSRRCSARPSRAAICMTALRIREKDQAAAKAAAGASWTQSGLVFTTGPVRRSSRGTWTVV